MNERDLFLAALDFTDPAARCEYLDQACSGNAALRASVEALFASHKGAGDFLKTPIAQAPGVQPPSSKLSSDTKVENPSSSAPVKHTDQFSTVQVSLEQKSENSQDDESDDETADEKVPLGFLLPTTKPGALGRLAHYEVMEILGRGAFGTVLKGFDEKLHRMVAIKVMSAELASTSPARKRFLREARASAAIRHEHVVAIYGVEEQPIPYLVMEYIPGRTRGRPRNWMTLGRVPFPDTVLPGVRMGGWRFQRVRKSASMG